MMRATRVLELPRNNNTNKSSTWLKKAHDRTINIKSELLHKKSIRHGIKHCNKVNQTAPNRRTHTQPGYLEKKSGQC